MINLKQTHSIPFAIVSFISLVFLLAAPVVLAASPAAAEPLKCSVLQSVCDAANNGSSENVMQTGVGQLLLLVTNILTAGVGIVAVGGIIYGAFLYTTASGSAEQVKKAYKIFINVGIGVLMFGIMYSLIQWLVPGGAFTS